MRAVVTGGAGFIGQALVRTLRERDDELVAIVRDQERAAALAALGCQLVEADLGSVTVERLAEMLIGADAVFHLAGSYRVGIPESEHVAMFSANVVATRTVLDAAINAAVPRIVHVSTINVFGNTSGRVVDEGYRRPQPPAFLSYYDETKYLAHLAAEERIAAGAPVLIAMPGQNYGPGDHSELGGVVKQAIDGTLTVLNAADLGVSLVHVDDVAAGILLVHDRGTIGEAYALGGEITTLGEVVRRAAALAGTEPPKVSTPSWLLRGLAPLGALIGPVLGGDPNIGETIRASVGVTYWASSEKAKRELGYAPRELEAGLRTLL